MVLIWSLVARPKDMGVWELVGSSLGIEHCWEKGARASVMKGIPVWARVISSRHGLKENSWDAV